MRAEQFEHIDFTFFASDPGGTRNNWKRAHDAGSALVDLSDALEEEPGAMVRSVWLERECGEAIGNRSCSRLRVWCLILRL